MLHGKLLDGTVVLYFTAYALWIVQRASFFEAMSNRRDEVRFFT